MKCNAGNAKITLPEKIFLLALLLEVLTDKESVTLITLITL